MAEEPVSEETVQPADSSELDSPEGLEPQVEIEVDDWDQMVSLLAFTGWEAGWIFRGQSNYAWPANTGLARTMTSLGVEEVNWTNLENSAIGFFMDRANGLLDNVPDEHDLLGWLTLMQHYGAPTRLLDWSQSPFVAAYFAYERPSNTDGAIYALNAFLCQRKHKGAAFPIPWDHLGTAASSRVDKEGNSTTNYPTRDLYRRDELNESIRWAIKSRSGWPLPVIPVDQDARMVAQQTIMTVAGDLLLPVDVLMEKDMWPKPSLQPGGLVGGSDAFIWPLDRPTHVIRKIRLRQSWRDDALITLGRMGITSASLFPGLDGLGRATRQHVELGRLALRDIMWGGFGPRSR